jgi:hypothetical protein
MTTGQFEKGGVWTLRQPPTRDTVNVCLISRRTQNVGRIEDPTRRVLILVVVVMASLRIHQLESTEGFSRERHAQAPTLAIHDES